MWSSILLIYLNFLGYYSGHNYPFCIGEWFGVGKLDEWILILIKHDGLEKGIPFKYGKIGYTPEV